MKIEISGNLIGVIQDASGKFWARIIHYPDLHESQIRINREHFYALNVNHKPAKITIEIEQ